MLDCFLFLSKNLEIIEKKFIYRLQEAVMDDEYISGQELNSLEDENSEGPRVSSESSGMKSHQPKAAYCDSCDSDDYADSDN